MITNRQKQIIDQYLNPKQKLSISTIVAICEKKVAVENLDDNELVEFLTLANTLYRTGEQIISDYDYDLIFLVELKKRLPDHPFLHHVEPEKAFTGKTIKLPHTMLSTEKVYNHAELQRWIERVNKAAAQLGIPINSLIFRATPKLDGFAAYDDGEHLYTRGDGKRGTDITRVMERGLIVANNGKRGLGAGEIVVSASYFQQHLADKFENSRNFQASVVKEKELGSATAKAIEAKAVVFFPFSLLPSWQGSSVQLIEHLDEIITQQYNSVDYDVDGVVIEIINDELKTYMGATRHHHRWQVALKENLATAKVKVVQVHPQTSRSGRVNPVVEIEPVRLSGALIQRVTAHHYGMVKEKGIGPGAIIELTRSGEVIPKIIQVISAVDPELPPCCPSCGAKLIWDNDYLFCTNNTQCPAQISHTIEHFFRTLGNIDGFGPATIDKLYANEIRSIVKIYTMDSEDFEQVGFGPKQSLNLVNQLQRSRVEQIEDWRFLAAFGIFRMGGGNCENLLRHYPLDEIFTLSIDQIINIEGFALKTAEAITDELQRIRPMFNELTSLGFNLETTTRSDNPPSTTSSSPIAGKLLVFTGTMKRGKRSDMQAQAKKLGAKIGSTISAKTDYLITGENVGATKINAAQEKGVQIVSESEYLAMLTTPAPQPEQPPQPSLAF